MGKMCINNTSVRVTVASRVGLLTVMHGKVLEYSDNKTSWKRWEGCRRQFKTDLCFEKHVEEGTCQNIYICTDCGNFVDKKRLPKGEKQHSCTDNYYPTCNQWVVDSHLCFMQPENLPDGDQNVKYLESIFSMILNVSKTPGNMYPI